MKIGILIPGFSDGEQDWCIPVYLNLVRALAEQDSVRVFALRYPSRKDRYRVYSAQVISLGGHSQIAGLRRWSLLARTVRTVLQEHRRQPFDILHAIWADETGYAACLIGRLIGVPVVVSIAGGELATLPGYGLQRGKVSRWLVRQALRHADQVIAPSRYAAHMVPASLRSQARVAMVPLGVDTALFKPVEITSRSDHSAERQMRLLSVGSLIEVKGHEQLLTAIARLPGIRLDLVGDGPLLPILRAQARTLGVEDRVVFHGAIQHDALPALYQSADVHVLTSQHEAFGMVIAEAGACGVPTTGYALGILPEFAEYEAGVAVPAGDLDALVTAIRTLSEDSARLAIMGRNACKLVEDRYTIAAMTQGICAEYAKLYASQNFWRTLLARNFDSDECE